MSGKLKGQREERWKREEKKERRLIFLSRWWSYLKRGREGEREPSACSQRARGGGARQDGTKEEGIKGQSQKVAMHACTRRGIRSSHALALSEGKRRTCGICEPEGDGLVFDVAHVANGHLARVVGKVFGSEVLDLQHLGFTLRGSEQSRMWVFFFLYSGGRVGPCNVLVGS